MKHPIIPFTHRRLVTFVASLLLFLTVLILHGTFAEAEMVEAVPETQQEAPAYVSGISVERMEDGAAPFDHDDTPGNDSGPGNGIVRSFDTITYTLAYSTALNPGAAAQPEATMRVSFTLPVSSREAVFDTASMPWLIDAEVSEQDGVQTLTGKRELPNSSGVAVPGAGTLSVVVTVQGAANGTEIQPEFQLSLSDDPSQSIETTADIVTVSAAPKYNIRLKQNTSLSRKDSYNFTTGKVASDTDTSSDQIVSGRMYGYGITVQLYNDNAEKGLKGIELPAGDLTFDLELSMTENRGDGKGDIDITDSSTPLLWDYKLNDKNNSGNLKRNLFFDSIVNTRYATFAAPWSSGSKYHSLYNKAGAYRMSQKSETVSVTLSGYEFNSFQFPTHDAGDEATASARFGVHVGSFSSAYLQILAPFPEDASEETDYNLTVRVTNMKATAVSGAQATVQADSSDDAVSVNVPYRLSGSYSKYTWFKQGYGLGETAGVMGSHYTNGDAWAAPGSVFVISSNYLVSQSTDAEGYLHAVNVLQKFDDRAFQPLEEWNGKQYSKHTNSGEDDGMETTVLYAAKPDQSGWESDSEMNSTREDALIYFKSLAELEQQGYTCVAFLAECRGGIRSVGRTELYFPVRLRDTAVIGEVYQTVNDLRCWTRDTAPDASVSWENPASVAGSANYAEYKETVRNYTKTTYHGDGSTSGHTGSYVAGNSLLAVAYRSTITKTASLPGSEPTKAVFDLDSGERVVEFQIKPTISMANGSDSRNAKTNVTVTDTLPKGLTYITGSSLAGDNSNEPEIDSHEDGSTTLVWMFEDVPVGTAMAQIRYSASIGNLENPKDDVQNNDSLTSTVTIQADGDGRAISSVFGNQSAVGIKVSKLSAISLIKQPVQAKNDPGSEIGYIIRYANSSANTIKNYSLLDILPHPGDSRGTAFNGTLTPKSISITSAGENGSKFTLLATAEKITDPDVQKADLSQFRKLEGNHGTYRLSGNETAFLLHGDLPDYSALSVTILFDTDGNEPGDRYYNDSSVYADNGFAATVYSTVALAEVAGRSIEGTAWIDSNGNGIIDDEEEYLEGLEVTLYTADGSKVTRDVQGNEIKPVKTGSNGEYSFSLLPEGDYQVLFTGTEDVELNNFTVTQKTEGGSCVTGTYEGGGLISASTETISLPALPALEPADYIVRDVDAGFVPVQVNVEYRWVGDAHPSDVEAPSGDTVHKGSSYHSKDQDKTEEYFTFSGWFADEALTEPYLDGTVLLEDTVLYGKWTMQYVSVAYHWISTENPSDVTKPAAVTAHRKGMPYTAEDQEQTKEYFAAFNGWYTDKELTQPYGDDTSLLEDLNLYGEWIPEYVSVAYQWVSEDNPLDVEPPPAETGIRRGTGYDAREQQGTSEYFEPFAGWYTDEALQEAFVDGTVLTEDIVLYGKWARSTVTVSYEWVGTDFPSDVTVPETDTVSKGSSYDAREQEMPAGHIAFEGWYLDETLTEPYSDGTRLYADTVLYGRWERQCVTVRYCWVSADNPTDVAPPAGHEVHKGSPYTAEVQELTKEPFAFDGWYADEELENSFIDGTKLVEDLILFGEWAQVTVTEEEKEEDDRSADEEKEPSEDASPVKTGDSLPYGLLVLMITGGVGIIWSCHRKKSRSG